MPCEDHIAEFLACWSEKKFWAGTRKGRHLEQRFGLSRATTLLHFVSGGRYPIVDGRVEAAMSRLSSPVEMTVDGYLTFCTLFFELASASGVSGKKGLRRLDHALFCYGLDSIRLSSIDPSDKSGNSDDCGSSVCRFGSQDRNVYTEASGAAKMSRYTVFIEPTAAGYSAHVPDLPGCIAAASTLEETRQLIKEAIEFHIEGKRIDGEAIP